MILLIDNYDSFAYNLYQLIGSIDEDIKVIRNDEMTVEEIEELQPSCIIISPGPGKPSEAGIIEEVVQKCYTKYPILGVCLGHQAIVEAFGGTVSYAQSVMHGKSSIIKVDTTNPIFKGIEKKTAVARYHSLAAKKENLPECLKIIGESDDGEIMAISHKNYPVYGLQFHPESILTKEGKKIVENFLKEIQMIRGAIIKLSKKEDLTYQEAYECMNEIMDDQASDIQKAAYLTALSLKGETIDEITASAKGMREHCVKLLNDQDVLEIVGTGGDGSNSFNISTTSSIVIASGGVKVAKHGNRAASSKSGAADCLEALGVDITINEKRSKELLNDINICFLFAQNYHLAMKYVAPVRKELGIRTVFNILGPLTNPAGATYQVMGVYDESLVELLAQVLSNLGVKRAMVVYGRDGLDEISASNETFVCEINENQFKTYTISPEQFGLQRCLKDELVGGTPKENAQITRDVLNGKQGGSRTAVLMNAGAGLYIGGKVDSLQAGIDLAAELIDSGKANEKLEEFIKESNK